MALMGALRDWDLPHDVIGSNGIQTAEAMKSRLALGVNAVSATTLFYESRDWGQAVDKLLTDYANLRV